MPRDYPDNEPDDLWDEDYPEDADDDTSETVRCPECDAEVYEDAVQCPSCGHYLSPDTNPWSGRPVWWILLGLIGILATVLTLAGVFP